MRKAFSLIELVIVIVVIGILAVNMMPNLKANNRADAMNHILTMIRYTQNLALHDNKQLRDDESWQNRYWRFVISHNDSEQLCFTVGSNIEGSTSNSIAIEETAVDPANGKRLFCPTTGGDVHKDARYSSNVFLNKKFGLQKVDITFADGTSYENGLVNKYLSFDKFGRPHGQYSNTTPVAYLSYIKQDVRMTFYFANAATAPFTVRINTETGYVFVEENPRL